MDDLELIKKANKARESAYAPYSSFTVGAALLTAGGKLYTGCNIENAAFSPTLCAERTAAAKAVSDGELHFTALAVSGGPAGAAILPLCTPCGVCRQFIREFCVPSEMRILVSYGDDNYKVYTLDELLPYSFGPETLK